MNKNGNVGVNAIGQHRVEKTSEMLHLRGRFRFHIYFMARNKKVGSISCNSELQCSTIGEWTGSNLLEVCIKSHQQNTFLEYNIEWAKTPIQTKQQPTFLTLVKNRPTSLSLKIAFNDFAFSFWWSTHCLLDKISYCWLCSLSPCLTQLQPILVHFAPTTVPIDLTALSRKTLASGTATRSTPTAIDPKPLLVCLTWRLNRRKTACCGKQCSILKLIWIFLLKQPFQYQQTELFDQ